MTYTVQFEKTARKELASVPEPFRKRLAAKIEKLAENPFPHGVEKLEGHTDRWRIRESNYRAVYRIDGHILVVTVIKIANRREVYRKR